MKWNKYPEIVELHAFLSPSKYHWVNYEEDKLEVVYRNYKAAQVGTELHAFAAEAIRLGIKLRTRKTLSLFVNDAIGFSMDPEVVLYYSPNCYGTTDAISFRSGLLRIHDLKTGITKTSFKQLEIYAALFCLEYQEDPADIRCELRIYQSNEILIHEPSYEDIMFIIQKIKEFDLRIQEMSKTKGA